MKKFHTLAAIAALAGAMNLAHAEVVVLDFEGVGNFNPVGNFYNGGLGINYGIEFSPNALGLIDADAGGGGNFGGEPSPDTALFFITGAAATMNIAAGFTTGFSFFYSAVNFGGSVVVYEGLNATGNVLAFLNLPVTPSTGGDPSGDFSPFFAIGVTFEGTALSVDFAGAVDQIGFDDITLGSERPGGIAVPDPASTAALMLAGLAGLVGLARRNK